jgi:RNA ligase (TIGR02306 family)
MTRKLVTIEKVRDLLPIAGADKIEVAMIKGWPVVVKKSEFSIGDMVCYFEIDSWVPTEVAPFLTKEGHEPKEFEGVKGERLKTIKLRKQISQGLVLPLSIVPNGDSLNEGDDVTEVLGVKKWEMPDNPVPGRQVQAQGIKRFPVFIPKTDQERIQNYGHMVVNALDEEFEVTMKKDGSSMTVFIVTPESEHYKAAKALSKQRLSLWEKVKAFFVRKPDEPVYGICSRNIMLPLTGDSNFHKAAAPVLAAMKEAYAKFEQDSYALQGEVVAPDIQGNYEKVKDVEFHIFDIFNIDKQMYSSPASRQEAVGILGLNHVTVLATGTLRDVLGLPEGEVSVDDVVSKCLTYASGPGDNAGVMREGVVFKNCGCDFSFKAISNEYLLKKG